MQRDELAALITEYERLLRWFRRLTVEADIVDRRLTDIERKLPDSYVGPDDPPTDRPVAEDSPMPSNPLGEKP